MDATRRRTDAPPDPTLQVRAWALLAVAASAGYVGWLLINSLSAPALGIPLLALEVFGLLQLVLHTFQGWTDPAHVRASEGDSLVVDQVIVEFA